MLNIYVFLIEFYCKQTEILLLKCWEFECWLFHFVTWIWLSSFLLKISQQIFSSLIGVQNLLLIQDYYYIVAVVLEVVIAWYDLLVGWYRLDWQVLMQMEEEDTDCYLQSFLKIYIYGICLFSVSVSVFFKSYSDCEARVF